MEEIKLRNKEAKYALASDIDGTLFFPELADHYKPGDLTAIRHFQRAGGLFGVCTGRPVCNFDEIRALNLDFYIVSSGALLLDRDFQIVEETPISIELAKKVFNEYKHRAGIIVQTDSYTNLYATFVESMNNAVFIIDDFDAINEDKIYSLSLIVEDDKEARHIAEELNSNFLELAGFQNKNAVDIVKRGCSKGTAVKKMKQLLGVEKIAGIGDSYNDISLIENADIGFTFHASPKAVQDQAEYVVDSIEQAIDILLS